jgi:hypothetical protein
MIATLPKEVENQPSAQNEIKNLLHLYYIKIGKGKVVPVLN